MMKNISDQENMSNLTSASNEAISVSSTSRDGGDFGGGLFLPHCSIPSHRLNQTQPSAKKKRNQPGHPDPEAEVISLSPRSLLATNRFVCDVCNKGFQRDQNLQLHRRGHNLPWKLKQRSNNDAIIRKKVYVCPETSCIHHEPSRALGDLTGVKKHFSRKHGEKKWKCDKCTKKYAVLSDWKAHSKICGTKEYRCDCGTLFSRRDSFITHRAFCDALAQDNAIRSKTAKSNSDIIPQLQQIESQFIDHHQIPVYHPIKKEVLQGFTMSLNPSDFQPWSTPSGPPAPVPLDHTTPSIFQYFHQNPNPNMGPSALLPPPPHISATSLLQKSAEMGAKRSSGMASYYNGSATTSHTDHNPPSSLFYDMMMMGDPAATSFDRDDRRMEEHDQESLDFHAALDEFSRSRNDDNHGAGTTRDFLGLRALSQSDFMSIAGLSNCMGSSSSSNGNACNNKS